MCKLKKLRFETLHTRPLGQNSSPSDLHFILLFHYSYTVIVLSVRDSWNSLPPEVVDIPSSL